MGQAIPRQHPAVVLRSHYLQLRALLAVAMIAVVGLAAAVVVLATNRDSDTVTRSAAPVVSVAGPTGATRYDGGPEEGTRGMRSLSQPASAPAGTRYDGGPEEGTRGMPSLSQPTSPPATARYDGGPEEGTRGAGH